MAVPEELLPLIDEAIDLLKGPRYQALRRAFAIWILRVVLERAGMATPGKVVTDLLEVRAMLAERVTQWKDEYIRQGVLIGREEGLTEGLSIGREEGLSIGREEGLTEGLSRGREESMVLIQDLLESRLGALPEEAAEAIRARAVSGNLRGLMPAALRATSYADFLEEVKRLGQVAATASGADK